jgi:hypothetical protein
LFALISWIAALTIFKPKIVVTTVGGLNPLAPRFEISNDSTFSIYKISTFAILNGVYCATPFRNVGLSIKPPQIEEIEPGSKPRQFMIEAFTFSGNAPPPTTGESMHIDLIIRFRPSFAWWRYKTTRQFTGNVLPNGTMEWAESAKEFGHH